MVYCEATIMEVQRCTGIAPLALPHRALKDIEYEGEAFVSNLNNKIFTLLSPIRLCDPQGQHRSVRVALRDEGRGILGRPRDAEA